MEPFFTYELNFKETNMSELVEYKSGTAFPGVIGRTVAESSPAWPEPVRAPEGSPNIIFFDKENNFLPEKSLTGFIPPKVFAKHLEGIK